MVVTTNDGLCNVCLSVYPSICLFAMVAYGKSISDTNLYYCIYIIKH